MFLKREYVLILFILVLLISAEQAFAQLKNFEVREIRASEYVIYTKHPDCAVLSVESSIKNLVFKSNMDGIVEQEYRGEENRYVIYLRPFRQKITVQHRDFREAEVKMLTGLKAKDMLAFIIEEELSTDAKGTFIIESDPAGAEITIDGIPGLNKKTPATLADMRAMQYRITISNYRHQDSTFVTTLRANEVKKVSVKLRPNFGGLVVNSNPPNSRVFINDVPRGTTPLRFTGIQDGLDAGTYRIRISTERHKQVEKTVHIVAGKESVENFNLEPQYGSLTVTSEPPGADVYINGKLEGKSPLTLSGISKGMDPGSYSIRLVPESDFFQEQTHMVQIKAGEFVPLQVNFSQSTALLTVSSAMSPFEVFLDGVLNTELSKGNEVQVPARAYSVRVVFKGTNHQGYEAHVEDVNLVTGDKRRISPNFKSNLVKISFVSDLPYTRLEIYDLEQKTKYFDDILKGDIDLAPGDYLLIATKNNYVDFYAKINVDRVTQPKRTITMLPLDILSFIEENNSIKQPANLNLTSLAGKKMMLKWDFVDQAEAYIIDKKVSNKWQNGYAVVSSTTNEWIDASLGQPSDYRLCAIKGGARSKIVYSSGEMETNVAASAAYSVRSRKAINYSSEWASLKSFPGPVRESAIAFLIGDNIYYGMGITSFKRVLGDFWVYNTVTDQWKQLRDFPGPSRYGSFSFVIGNRAFIGTGRGQQFFKDVWEYSPNEDSWTKKKDFPGKPRYEPVSFVLDNIGYIGLGGTGSYLRDLWSYDVEKDRWYMKANYPGKPQRSATTAVVDNMAYVGFGFNGEYQNQFYSYNPTADKWQLESKLNVQSTEGAFLFSPNGTLFCGLSADKNEETVFWVYDITSHQWTQSRLKLGSSRKGALTFITQDKIILGFGQFKNNQNTELWRYYF